MKVILLCAVFMVKGSSAKQSFDVLPEDEIVRPGESITLKCVISDLQGTCSWRYGGKVRAVQGFEPAGAFAGKYEWSKNSKGDCSLIIRDAEAEDEGLWICEVSGSDDVAENELRAELFLSVGDNCQIGRPCSKPGRGRLTGRPVRYSPKSFRPNYHHPFGAILRSTYWNRTLKPMKAETHPFFEGLEHKHYHHQHDFFGRK